MLAAHLSDLPLNMSTREMTCLPPQTQTSIPPPETSILTPHKPPDRHRWLLLALFCGHTCLNNGMWLTFAIVYDATLAYFRMDDHRLLDWCNSSGLIVYCLFFFAASWFFESYGLKHGVVFAACVQSLGTWVRVATLAPSPRGFAGQCTSYFVCSIVFHVFHRPFIIDISLCVLCPCLAAVCVHLPVVGEVLISIAAPWLLATPSRLAVLWFPPAERATATGLGVFANTLGLAASYIIIPAWVSSTGEGLDSFLMLEAGLQTGLTVLTVLLWRPDSVAYRPVHPSDSVPEPAEHSCARFASSFCRVMRDRSFLALAVAYGCHIGVRCHFPFGCCGFFSM
jgi:hypothetical protein